MGKRRAGHRDIVTIGASVGGVEALTQLAKRIPRDLPAAIFVVQHVAPEHRSILPRILTREGEVPALHPQDGVPIEHGKIYVAPPGRHLVLEGDRVRVIRGPRENGHRPAVDTLFRSAALSFERRVIGIVLTGNGTCGTAGLFAIKKRGGVAIVQDPADAVAPSMPQSAIDNVEVDFRLPLEEIAERLDALVREALPTRKRDASPKEMALESALSMLAVPALEQEERPGRVSPFACPDCGGVLWEMDDGGHLRFKCRVGHGHTAESLGSVQEHEVETALWAALRAIEENASLLRRMAERARLRNQRRTSESYEEKAWAARRQALVIRQLLLGENGSAEQIEGAGMPR